MLEKKNLNMITESFFQYGNELHAMCITLIHTYILYCLAPPWGLFAHTEIKKIKDKNIYNKEEK